MTSSPADQLVAAPLAGHTLNVSRVVKETADAVSVVFDVPAELQHQFQYTPGQFLTLHVPHTAGPVARCYSISSAPGVDRELQVTIKRVPNGLASNWLCDNVKRGTSLTTLRPAGAFTPDRWDVDLLLFAAGSGITPIMSILKTALAGHANRVVLVYANRNVPDVIFRREISRLEALHPHRLDVCHWIDSVDGPPTPKELARRVGSLTQNSHAYLCGPPEFMTCAQRALIERGLDEARIHREVFTSLKESPFAPQLSRPRSATTPVETARRAARVLAEIDGEKHTIDWSSSEVLLDALLAQELRPPYVCREGNCGACAFTLLEGEVKMLANDTLDDYDTAKGLRLACQSVPVSDTLSIIFDQ